VVIDQAYSYTPATNALLAMAYGQCVVSGGEDAYYTFIGEGPNRPIFNSPIDVDGMTRLFEDIITHPEELRERGRRSREFVVTHNNYLTVARRYLNFWASHL
jgi:glycosyltransferase involved in cell wall biosynthesis